MLKISPTISNKETISLAIKKIQVIDNTNEMHMKTSLYFGGFLLSEVHHITTEAQSPNISTALHNGINPIWVANESAASNITKGENIG
mmetsp:Transcript_26147/g.36813  ORF Transcript_26147/g.36813 Transcript_26147/m.36813 type:complete len:88 (-) Transcript_26147:151-414(-)